MWMAGPFYHPGSLQATRMAISMGGELMLEVPLLHPLLRPLEWQQPARVGRLKRL